MSHGTDATVECPRCGTAFDPSLSGGWCTDPECGSWRFDGAAGSDSGRAMTDGGTDEADDGGTDAETGSADEGSDESAASEGSSGETDGESGESNAETESAETVKVRPDGDADGEGDAVDDEHEGESEDSGSDDSTSETVACPACETEIAVEDNFCRSCGTDVSGIGDSGRLTACPDCGSDVEPADSFCRECGEHLDAHRPGTDATPPAAAGGRVGSSPPAETSDGSPGPAPGPQGGRSGGPSQQAGAPNQHVGAPNQQAGAPNRNSGAATAETVKLGGGGASTAAAGEGSAQNGPVSDATGQGDAGTETPTATDGPRLSLVARNREVAVGDGDTVGKEIRSIIMDTGGDEEDAVRVHREHVRFEREGEQFYLVDLGKNPTVVNGEELEQGDRVPVEPGDRIDLSGVARIGVRQA